MRLHRSPSLSLLGLLWLAGGCQSNGDVSPATTTTPVATIQKGMVARINNQAWQSTTEQTTTDKAYFAVRGGTNPNELTIIGVGAFTGVSNAAKTDRITIFLASVTGVGTYTLAADNKAVYTATTSTLTNYTTDATRTGTVTVTKSDLTTGLFSGTFSFSAVSGSTSVTVTDGQFVDIPISR